MRDWIDYDFDPQAFSVDKVNRLLTLFRSARIHDIMRASSVTARVPK